MPADIGVQPFQQRFPWFGGDLQTTRDFFVRPVETIPAASSETLRFTMPDGTGDVLIGILDRPAETVSGRPLVILVHGLTGSSESGYVRRMARALLEAGYAALRLNLRGAGASRPLCREQYHSGRSEDLLEVISQLDAPDGVALVGWSLGGNVVLKATAEAGAGSGLRAGVAISTPIDLMSTARCFTLPRNAGYQRHLLAAMRDEMLSAPEGVSNEERRRLAAVRTVIDFDDAFTAPKNGFIDAADYYGRCSANQVLPNIRIPTRVLHALDDPWIPAQMYLEVDWGNCPSVHATLTRRGGHVGFHARDGVWSDRETVRFLDGL